MKPTVTITIKESDAFVLLEYAKEKTDRMWVSLETVYRENGLMTESLKKKQEEYFALIHLMDALLNNGTAEEGK